MKKIKVLFLCAFLVGCRASVEEVASIDDPEVSQKKEAPALSSVTLDRNQASSCYEWFVDVYAAEQEGTEAEEDHEASSEENAMALMEESDKAPQDAEGADEEALRGECMNDLAQISEDTSRMGKPLTIEDWTQVRVCMWIPSIKDPEQAQLLCLPRWFFEDSFENSLEKDQEQDQE